MVLRLHGENEDDDDYRAVPSDPLNLSDVRGPAETSVDDAEKKGIFNGKCALEYAESRVMFQIQDHQGKH